MLSLIETFSRGEVQVNLFEDDTKELFFTVDLIGRMGEQDILCALLHDMNQWVTDNRRIGELVSV